jgi:hypothetical protein
VNSLVATIGEHGWFVCQNQLIVGCRGTFSAQQQLESLQKTMYILEGEERIITL